MEGCGHGAWYWRLKTREQAVGREDGWKVKEIKDKLGPHKNSLNLGSALVASDGIGCPSKVGAFVIELKAYT